MTFVFSVGYELLSKAGTALLENLACESATGFLRDQAQSRHGQLKRTYYEAQRPAILLKGQSHF